ncbi:hypothetical protein BJ165DRAFT_4035 [Panaeolus papilionaceus]|nr:hypothetical protein BJ165DRAFT_4035 [Panaeolus papilionaceus]
MRNDVTMAVECYFRDGWRSWNKHVLVTRCRKSESMQHLVFMKNEGKQFIVANSQCLPYPKPWRIEPAQGLLSRFMFAVENMARYFLLIASPTENYPAQFRHRHISGTVSWHLLFLTQNKPNQRPARPSLHLLIPVIFELDAKGHSDLTFTSLHPSRSSGFSSSRIPILRIINPSVFLH